MINTRIKAVALGVCVVIIIILIFVLVPTPANDREVLRKKYEHTVSNARSLSMGLIMYAADYDDKLPVAENWMDAIEPYIKNNDLFIASEVDGVKTYFAFFEPLSGLDVHQFTNPGEMPLVFQTDFSARNLHGGLDRIFWEKWPDDKELCAVGFLDGHAKYKDKSWALETIKMEIKEAD